MPQEKPQEFNWEAARRNALDAGYSSEQVDEFIKNRKAEIAAKENKIEATKPKSFEESLAAAAPKISNIRQKTTKDAIKEYLEKLRTPISAGVGLGAGAGMAATGYGAGASGAAASAGAAGSDYLINKFLGIPETYPLSETAGIIKEGESMSGSPIFNAAASIGENVAMNEALGTLLKIPIKAGSNAAYNIIREADTGATSRIPSIFGDRPSGLNALQRLVANIRDKAISRFGAPAGMPTVGKGSVSGEISQFDPTFSQYLASRGKGTFLAKIPENIFTPRAKFMSIINSAAKVREEAGQFVKSLTGRRNVDLNSVDEIARGLQIKAQTNLDNLNIAIKDTKDNILMASSAAQKKTLEAELKQLQEAKMNFYPGHERGVGIKDLIPEHPTGIPTHSISSTNAPTPIVKEIVESAPKIQRFINTGEIQIGNIKITSARPKRDMAGEAFAMIFNDARNLGNDSLNAIKLKNTWNAYKISDAGRKLFDNAQTRANMDKFIDVAINISDKFGDQGASKYLVLKLGSGAAQVGGGIVAGLATGALTGSTPAGAAIIGGSIGLNQLGKLMTNPDTARMLIAMISGGPLNTSPAVISRVIGRALRGQPMTVQAKDESGKVIDIPGKINALGKFEAAPAGTGSEIKVKGQ